MAQDYPIDLVDAEWKVLEPFIPKPKLGGRPHTTDVRGNVREAAGFKPMQSGGIIDSQTVKTTEQGESVGMMVTRRFADAGDIWWSMS